MAMISLTLPDFLAKQSQDVAKKMRVSRAHFIRMALEHEIEAFRVRQERNEMLGAFKKMKQYPNYISEAEMWMDKSNTSLKDESDGWWKK